jgi:hypothetical protein
MFPTMPRLRRLSRRSSSGSWAKVFSREQAFERIKNEIARVYQEEDEAARRLID